MHWRPADIADAPLLAKMNHQLIADEGHRNPMNVEQLRERMATWLAGEYRGVVFEQSPETLGYALYRIEEKARVHLRHFFIARPHRRRGLGREAFRLLRAEIIPPDRRVVLEVLTANSMARAFWAAVGFQEYAISMELGPHTRLEAL